MIGKLRICKKEKKKKWLEDYFVFKEYCLGISFIWIVLFEIKNIEFEFYSIVYFDEVLYKLLFLFY